MREKVTNPLGCISFVSNGEVVYAVRSHIPETTRMHGSIYTSSKRSGFWSQGYPLQGVRLCLKKLKIQ